MPIILELVGPRYLPEGKNFYQQPPFEQIVYKAAKTTRFSERQFRMGISLATGVIHEPRSINRSPRGFNRTEIRRLIGEMSRENELFKEIELGEETFGALKEDYTRRLFRIVELLEPFPYWSSYVHAKGGAAAGYKSDGTRSRRRYALDDIEPAYPYWLQKILTSQGTRKLWGVYDLNPTDNPGEEAARTGQRLEHRRWIIRQIMR